MHLVDDVNAALWVVKGIFREKREEEGGWSLMSMWVAGADTADDAKGQECQ